jgi:hypothetical protein
MVIKGIRGARGKTRGRVAGSREIWAKGGRGLENTVYDNLTRKHHKTCKHSKHVTILTCEIRELTQRGIALEQSLAFTPPGSLRHAKPRF